jgi:Flp pilus assembly protein TadG
MLRCNQHSRQSNHARARATLRGQVMIIFALATVVLVGMMALAVDVGFLMAERRQVQSAADSAALAAAQSALDNDLAGMTAAAESYATENAGNGATVTVNPNAAGPGAAERYVEVTVTIDVQRFFLGAVYQGDWSTTASAMAAVEGIEGNYALITLDENAIPGIYLNGTTGIVISGNEGGAASNSTIHGLSNTTFNVDGVIHAFGTIQQGSAWNAQRIVENRNRLVPDPIVAAGLNAPVPPAQERDQAYVDSCLNSNPCTLQPGRYTDVEIDMKNNDRIVMAPGLYYFDGDSSFDLKNNSELTGNGVLLYFTGSASLQPKNGNINLHSASPAGANNVPTLADVVVWVDNCTDVDLQGNGDMYFEGIFYAPCSHSWMHGGTTETIRGQLILGSLDVRGNTALRIAYEQRAATSQPAVFLVR